MDLNLYYRLKNQLIVCLILVLVPFFLTAQYSPKALEKAEETIAAFKEKNSKFDFWILSWLPVKCEVSYCILT